MCEQRKKVVEGTDLTKSIIPDSDNKKTQSTEGKIKSGDGAYINLSYDDVNFQSNKKGGKLE